MVGIPLLHLRGRQRLRHLASAFVLLLGLALTAAAQQGPDDDPDSASGYVNNAFHSPSVDSVNLYNGQLTIPIPVGPSYPIGPNLKFQALLTYNSRVTEYGNPGFQGSDWYHPLVGNPGLGIGWNFQLGKIGWCRVGSGMCFFRSDGAEISFFKTDPLNGSYLRTEDGSRYRLYAPLGLNGQSEMWDEDGNHYVFGHQVSGFDDDPNNYIHDFGRGRNGWYLTSLSDPFGNTMTVQYYSGNATPRWAYEPTPCTTMQMQVPPTGVNTWIPHYITLPTGQVTVNLDGSGRISSFVFPVHANGVATTRTWTLTYKPGGELYGRYCGGDVINVHLDEITALQPPEISSSYQFAYSNCGAAGLLTQLALPTGATIDYLYETYSFYHTRLARLAQCSAQSPPSTAPVEASGLPFCGGQAPDAPLIPPDPGDCTDEGRYEDKQTGVVRRTETVNGSASVTDYTQYAFPFGEQGSYGSPRGSQTLTIVLQPEDVNGKRRAKSVLFWASPKNTTTYAYGSRTGADIREAIYECDANPYGECDSGRPPGLIAQPACGGGNDYPFCPNHAVRVTYRTYEYDDATNESFNRRLSNETTYHQATASNGACSGCKYHAVAFSQSSGKNWETTNNRHFNVETHSGNLGNDSRTITTDWTQIASSWLPNLYIRQTTAEGSSTVDRYFEFVPTTGFLKGMFIHDAAAGRIFLTCRYPTTNGTPSQDFSATYTAWPEKPQPPPSSACTSYYPSPPPLAAGGDAFGKIYTHQNGLLTSAKWINGSVGASWKAVDYTRATSTGWITSSRDSAGFQTSYLYDGLGRVTSITPPGGEAATSVSYPSATQTIATRNGGTGLSTWERYDYDELGRLITERRQIATTPAPQYAKRFTKYDGLGNAYFTSEWVDDSTSETLSADIPTYCVFSGVNVSKFRPSAAPGTYRLCYDPFGRPQQVVGSKHSSLTTVDRTNGSSYYSDTREAVTTWCVNGTLNTNGTCGAGAVVPNPVTTNLRDSFGRLTSVTEPTGDATSYAYDVNGKVTSVTQGVQGRTFTYDAAGFLRSEFTPEKGTVTYTNYGSLGNVLSETQPGNLVLTRTYDFAGRLTGLSSNEGGSRTYLSNIFNNTTGGSSLGKLTSRTATNYALTPSNTVTDSFAYDSATGRVASQTTATSGGSSLTTTQSWKYNGLGLPAHHYHPRPSGASLFVVSYGYDSGLPVTQYANGIPVVRDVRYQASGSVSSYTTGLNTGKNMTTTVLQDVSLLARPAQIYTTAQATGLRPFDTSGYVYDGGGNIKTIGSDNFVYDNRSRLTSATYSGFPAQGYSYDRYGNLLSKGATTYSVSTSTNRLTTSSYDSRGNLTVNGGETYAYDGLDRQIRHTAAGSSWNYVFDGSNERVAKVPPSGSWTYTLRDEGNRVATEYSGATQSRDNVFLGNLAVVSYANAAVSGNGPVWTFYSSDHLGTPRLVTDIAGATVETRKSWPYGEDVGTPGTFQKLRFALMERDTEANRYYDHARSHEFGLGRFLSPDIRGGDADDVQSWNRYSYAGNNPLLYIDLDGRVKFPSTEARQAYNTAKAYLSYSAVALRVLRRFEALRGREEPTLTVNSADDDSYDSRANTISFDPSSGLDVSSEQGSSGAGGSWIQSPALGLLHEIDHALQDINVPKTYAKDANTPDPKFDNKEEQRVIEHVEARTAKQLGEPTRKTHGGNAVRRPQPAKSPCQTDPKACSNRSSLN